MRTTHSSESFDDIFRVLVRDGSSHDTADGRMGTDSGELDLSTVLVGIIVNQSLRHEVNVNP